MGKLFKLIFIAVVMTGQFESSNGYMTAREADLFKGQTFDFIIVGGGTAGCAVASRLAESGENSVLLIEAGGLPHPDLDVPALSPQHMGNPDVVKIYPTVKQRNAALSKNGVIDFVRGNMLGGSSGINGLVLNRGSPHDYNNWAKLTGDDSWSYENLLKYFKKSENYTGLYPPDQRGFHGPITVSRQRYAPGSIEWLQAGRELGYPIAEPNGPQIISFAEIDFTKKNGRRVTSYRGYIEPMLQSDITRNIHPTYPGRQTNLFILINTEVNRIIFEGKKAVGVKFTSGNSTHAIGYATARKEIILSAGAIDSPVLLMKSGIGPKSVLDEVGIPPVKYLPVGENLHEHPIVALAVIFGNKSAAIDEDNDLTPAAWRQFVEYGEGPYTSYLGQSNQAFLGSSHLPLEERNLGWSDFQLLAQNTNARSPIWDRDSIEGSLKEGEIAVPWVTWLGRPRSRGTVKLNPKDVDGTPLIDFQYLTNPYDVSVLGEGIKTYAKICEETEAFQKIGCRIAPNQAPACDHLRYHSDEYWECHGRQMTGFGYHAVGSCRMGRGPADPEAVVDPKLRVIGIEGLRVVDASIMPVVTNANTQAPVYAIAEKAADMIIHTWAGRTSSYGHLDDVK